MQVPAAMMCDLIFSILKRNLKQRVGACHTLDQVSKLSTKNELKPQVGNNHSQQFLMKVKLTEEIIATQFPAEEKELRN